MHKTLNLLCFPLLIIGTITLSNGLLGYSNIHEKYFNSNTKSANQINTLYSEKEITLKDPPISEVLSDKVQVKIRQKPLSPKIISKIDEKINVVVVSNLSETDFDYLEPTKKKFVKAVLPIIINENQNILITRNFLNEIRIKLKTFKTLNNSEINKLNNIAKKFSIKSVNKHKLDLVDELLSNVDVIPNSIALAQAAIESGWGESRFAREYNALFGEYTYNYSDGVVPLLREEGEKHLVKTFTSVDKSVQSYFNNLNSHYAYEDFREVREIMREKNNFSNIKLLVEELDSYAADTNYISTINAIIDANKLEQFDAFSYSINNS